MSDIDDVKHALNEWLDGLDSGDLDRMLATVDPEAVTCNEHQPTGYGIEAVREKICPSDRKPRRSSLVSTSSTSRFTKVSP